MSGLEMKLLSFSYKLVGKLKGYGEGLELLGYREIAEKVLDDARKCSRELDEMVEGER